MATESPNEDAWKGGKTDAERRREIIENHPDLKDKSVEQLESEFDNYEPSLQRRAEDDSDTSAWAETETETDADATDTQAAETGPSATRRANEERVPSRQPQPPAQAQAQAQDRDRDRRQRDADREPERTREHQQPRRQEPQGPPPQDQREQRRERDVQPEQDPEPFADLSDMEKAERMEADAKRTVRWDMQSRKYGTLKAELHKVGRREHYDFISAYQHYLQSIANNVENSPDQQDELEELVGSMPRDESGDLDLDNAGEDDQRRMARFAAESGAVPDGTVMTAFEDMLAAAIDGVDVSAAVLRRLLRTREVPDQTVVDGALKAHEFSSQDTEDGEAVEDFR